VLSTEILVSTAFASIIATNWLKLMILPSVMILRSLFSSPSFSFFIFIFLSIFYFVLFWHDCLVFSPLSLFLCMGKYFFFSLVLFCFFKLKSNKNSWLDAVVLRSKHSIQCSRSCWLSWKHLSQDSIRLLHGASRRDGPSGGYGSASVRNVQWNETFPVSIQLPDGLLWHICTRLEAEMITKNESCKRL